MLLKKIISVLQKSLLGYETKAITFSQAGEDLVIRNFFYSLLENKKKGFYVDIGAFHPYKHSNTFYLHLCGWHGINIDARSGSMKLFEKMRPKDINLEVAISDKKETLNYYYISENSGMNSFSEEYIKNIGQDKNVKKIIPIETTTLVEILEKKSASGKKIDFMNIDVEGLDYNVLNSNDWKKYRPTLISIEMYGGTIEELLNSKIATFLKNKNYSFYTRIPLATKNVNTVFFSDDQDKSEK